MLVMRLGLLVGLVLSVQAASWAAEPVVIHGEGAEDPQCELQPPPAILNDPSKTTEGIKAVIETLKPTAELIYDANRRDWTSGMSASLYAFRSEDIHLGRIKAGYASSNALYTGVDADIPGLILRYATGYFDTLDTVVEKIQKYSAVGMIAGYDLEDDEWVWGPSFGATLRF